MLLNDFNYSYPEELVAQEPLPERDSSRMMVVDRCSKTCHHKIVNELPKILKAGDCLVVNDSRVKSMRLFGNLSGGKPIELLLIEPVDNEQSEKPEVWKCIIKRAKRYRRGDQFFFGISAKAKVVGHNDNYLLVEFEPGHRERAMERRGVPPLPPYIKRSSFDSYSNLDRKRYQTVYADKDGSAAAPTAGLHLSHELIDEIKNVGVQIIPITLHVGLDTFQPVRSNDLEQHKMHGERFFVSNDSARDINCARKDGKRIIAVGTTTVRALESSCKDGLVMAGGGVTNLFIKPGYVFQVIEGLITNFHQPKSTLLMLVSAFAGKELIFECYREAIKKKYRLFSYGDCMAIL